MKRAVIIEARREGYALDQIQTTLTVGELIEALEEYDEDTPVYIGNDRQNYGFYTYGGLTWDAIEEAPSEELDDDEDCEEG